MVNQYTDEWLELRKNHIGASDASIIMGKSPWRTKEELLYEKCGLISPQKENYYMRRGKALEDAALRKFEEEIGLALMMPKVIMHKQIPYMFASLDGIDIEEKVMVEIKCPGKVDHALAQKGKIPEKYYPQLQHQIEVAGCEKSYYFSFTSENWCFVEVKRDDDFIKDLLKQEKEFWEKLQEMKLTIR